MAVNPANELLSAITKTVDTYRSTPPTKRATLLIPAWVKARLDATPAPERMEALFEVDRIAAAMGFVGWDIEIVPDSN